MNNLLTRKEFKRQVFERDNHKCVICGGSAVDAHHIIDRKVWIDGGYYLDNGVSLCEEHHWDAELSKITPVALREKIGLHTILPTHLDPQLIYDKWGNPV
jgi:hypothetical protein